MARILGHRHGLVHSGRRIIDRAHAQRQCVCAEAVGRSVRHLEAKGGVVRTVGIRTTRVAQFAGIDVGRSDLLVERHVRPVRAVAAVFEFAQALQCRDLDAGNRRGFDVAVGPEVIDRQHRGRVFKHRHRVVGRHRRVVDRRDVNRDGVGRLVKVDTAVGRAAVIFHLEGEVRVARAVGVAHRCIDHFAGYDVCDGNEVTSRHCCAVQTQRASCCHRSDLDLIQQVRRTVAAIAKAEVCCRQRVRRVFIRGDGLVGARRRIIHRGDAQRQSVCAGAIGRPVIDLESDRRVIRTVGVGAARVAEFAVSDIGRTDGLVQRHVRPVCAVAAVLQFAQALQRRDLHARNRRGFDVAVGSEVRQRQHGGRVFEYRCRVIGRHRRIVHRGDGDVERAGGAAVGPVGNLWNRPVPVIDRCKGVGAGVGDGDSALADNGH